MTVITGLFAPGHYAEEEQCFAIAQRYCNFRKSFTMVKMIFRNVDAYISSCPAEIRPKLQQLRKLIRDTAPLAEETISYNMPAYKFKGPLAYFAANKSHIGFYPTPTPLIALEKQLSAYKTSKGAIQFPNDQPIPVDLVKKMVKFKMKENIEKEASKRS